MSPAGLPTLKLRLGLLIVLAIGVTLATMLAAGAVGVQLRYGALAALVLSLGTVHVVARGTTRPLRELDAVAHRIAAGELTARVTVTGRDEVAVLGHAFNRMAAELETTAALRRTLVADAAHELRTPLAALQADLENAQDGVSTVDVDRLLTQVGRLATLTDRLLDLSRLDAGAEPLHRVRVSVERVARASLDAVGLTASDVEIDIPADLTVDADPDRLQQVLVNLLANAQRHAPGARIAVRGRAVDGSTVRLEVQDDGGGLSDADRERVFERFVRADGSRSTPGSGLGLAICRAVVTLHGGVIRIEPSLPRGCRVVVELPT